MATAPPTIEIRSFRAQAGNLVTPFLSFRRELRHDFPEPADGQLIAVERANRIVARPQIDFGQITQRAAGAHQSSVGRETRHASAGQLVPDVVAQTSELFRARRIILQKTLGQAKRAERKRQSLAHATAGKRGDLKTAASKIEEQAVLDRQTTNGAGEAVTSLLQAADDLDPDSEFPPQTFGEQRPVCRVPHRGRCDRDDTLRSGAFRDRLEVPHRLRRPRHGLFTELPSCVDVTDEPAATPSSRRAAAGGASHRA